MARRGSIAQRDSARTSRDHGLGQGCDQPAPSETMKKLIAILALLLCVSALGWLGLRVVSAGREGGAAAEAAPSSPGIPVMADLAGYSDVPVYLSGLGTV